VAPSYRKAHWKMWGSPPAHLFHRFLRQEGAVWISRIDVFCAGSIIKQSKVKLPTEPRSATDNLEKVGWATFQFEYEYFVALGMECS
jgi:hypothetical protein